MLKLIPYPAFVLGAILIHFGLLSLHVPLTAVPALTFFITIGFIIFLERAKPYRESWNENLGDFKTDLIQTLLILPVVAKLLELFYRDLQTKFNLHIWPKSWPFILQVIVIIFLAELLFYFYHRLAHTNKFLLKFHAVHHGADRVYWANSGRFHFVDTIGQSLFYFIPIFLLGASEEVAALFLTLNAITGTLEHANFEFKTIFLSRFFNTAELHRLHHSVKVSECNSNYGKILSIWDSAFGTYVKPKFKRETLKVGLPGGRPVPYDLWGQLKYPFVKKKK